MKRVLVTGGAGFLGSHLCDLLLSLDCEVMAFDCLHPQVHPLSPAWPTYPSEDVPVWHTQEGLTPWYGDVRDQQAVIHALMAFQPDTVIHLAALVGVAQSNEKIANYVSANVTGTAVLLNCLLDYNALSDDREASLAELAKDIEVTPEIKRWDVDGDTEVPVMETQDEANARHEAWRIQTKVQVEALPTSKVERVFVAGSMSAYGEGAYKRYLSGSGMESYSISRNPNDGQPMGLLECFELQPASVYAWTKAEQERLSLLIGKTRGLDVRVGRFFNIVGPRQALSNPYTGVGAIFASRVLSGLAPRVYEDGKQLRDFVHVEDVCRAVVSIMEHGDAGEVYNVGTGVSSSIFGLAEQISDYLCQDGDEPLEPVVTGEWRVGDIRHAFADASKLHALGWEPQYTLYDIVEDLCAWVGDQQAEEPTSLDRAHNDLKAAGLLHDGAK